MGETDPLLNTYVNAAKEAVRLSGTEFVLEDARPAQACGHDLDAGVDARWRAASSRARWMRRSSNPTRHSRSASWTATTCRGGSPIWRGRACAASATSGRTSRSTRQCCATSISPRISRVQVQKISWMDPARNEYEEDTPFDARIENNTDFSKLQAERRDQVPQTTRRLVQLRSDEQRRLPRRHRERAARQLDLGGAALLLHRVVRAGLRAGLAIDLRRRQPPPTGLHQTYQRHGRDLPSALARAGDRRRRRSSGAIPTYMDEFVKELKTAGSFLDVVRGRRLRLQSRTDSGAVLDPDEAGIARCSSDGRSCRRSSVESSGGGSVAALDTLIQFLVCRRRLSPFVGFPESAGSDHGSRSAWPIEWEALNDIASRHFQQLGICDKRVDANLGSQNSVLSAVVSTHFRGVIKKATHDASLFRQTWTVREPGSAGAPRLRGRADHAPLMLRNQNGCGGRDQGARRGRACRPARCCPATAADATLRAWVFGKILNWSVEHGIAVAADQTDRDPEGLCSPTLSRVSCCCCSSCSR